MTALDKLLDSVGWQDIETAPKDGTKVLLIRDNSYVIEHRTPIAEGFYSNGEWWCKYDFSKYRNKPTHWMPLPELKNTKEEKLAAIVREMREALEEVDYTETSMKALQRAEEIAGE